MPIVMGAFFPPGAGLKRFIHFAQTEAHEMVKHGRKIQMGGLECPHGFYSLLQACSFH